MGLTALSFVAGLVAVLSPCVLPVLPVVAAGALRGHRAGPLALAAGLITAFTGLGLVVAGGVAVLQLDADIVRQAGGALLVVLGLVLLSAAVQDRTSRWLSPLAGAAARVAARTGDGLGGQFAVGALLGGVWSPCVGPTLGAAFGLAAQGASLGQAGAMMAAFGLGSSVPLVVTAYAARTMRERRPLLLRLGSGGHGLLGASLVIMGLLVVSGLDTVVEAALLARLPSWWIEMLASR